ncbi:AAA family ATPase [Litchfieldia alkalitelluris]|uniref:AAA family ATPase n=1 Tax=Litchfieldia alkalitelluris TaxID=304268 RepID=UPI000998AEDD|nr:P-loop NTPase [Litchfieldia alkalitelluris]
MGEEQLTEKRKRGKLIVVCSAKGGIGKTLLTVNLSIAMFKKNLSLALVDSDLQFGDISLMMDLHPTLTIKDVIEEIGSVNPDSVITYLTRHSSGVKVLVAPDRPEYAELIDASHMGKIVDLLLYENDYVMIDTGVGLTNITLELIEQADQVIIVSNLEMTTLKNTKLMLETLDQIGLREKVKLVINQVKNDHVIKPEEAIKMLGAESLSLIPHNAKVATQSLNLGEPFVTCHSKSDLSKAVFKLAEELISEQILYKHKLKKTSFFQRLLGKESKSI